MAQRSTESLESTHDPACRSTEFTVSFCQSGVADGLVKNRKTRRVGGWGGEECVAS